MQKHLKTSMQFQRGLPHILVVACCFISCAITVALCVITVVSNQSSNKIATLISTVQSHETRIRLLESHNQHLRSILENAQARLHQADNLPVDAFERPAEVLDKPLSASNDLSGRQDAAKDTEEAEVIWNLKEDNGKFKEEKPHHMLEGTEEEKQVESLKTRWLRSTRQREAERSGRKECPKRCKGEKGDAGVKGQRGERGRSGKRGPAGECQCPTTELPTTATTTSATNKGPGLTTWSSARPAALLAAHFEGDRLATIPVGNWWDPINPGFVNLGETDDGWVPYWRYAEWMDTEMQSKFVLNVRGNVTVTEGGIYYVYSQMLYYDPSVFMGHGLYIGEQRKFSCTECTVDRDRKFNTCYIGGVVHINAGDNIGIKVSYTNRVISLNPENTHFGLIRLS